ncbi:Ig-like domain-containing protein [Dyadobacter sp. 3J3]|uniref:Ig-like domain-containing protein n=1 Tax=Dyadobacter sp. 3J3 TaxID=2606600 RepID=UPI001357F758|nr:Ig-like domain-containing protein [Dyadobacter sp. 3J3]
MKHLLLLSVCALLFTGCSKSEDKTPEPETIIDSPTIELKYDSQHQYALKKGSADVFPSTFNWISSNEKVGKVDANGLFKARKIGETTITGTAYGKNVESKVTITPYVTLFTEPYIEFGALKETIKSKEKRKLLTETATGLLYEGSSITQTRAVLYVFTNQRLASAGILFENATSTVALSSTFLKERYPDRATIDGKVYMLNDERTWGVVLTVDPSYGYMGVYLPNSTNGRMVSDQYNSAIESFKNIIKQN